MRLFTDGSSEAKPKTVTLHLVYQTFPSTATVDTSLRPADALDALAASGISWGLIAGGGHGGLHLWALDGIASCSLPSSVFYGSHPGNSPKEIEATGGAASTPSHEGEARDASNPACHRIPPKMHGPDIFDALQRDGCKATVVGEWVGPYTVQITVEVMPCAGTHSLDPSTSSHGPSDDAPPAKLSMVIPAFVLSNEPGAAAQAAKQVPVESSVPASVAAHRLVRGRQPASADRGMMLAGKIESAPGDSERTTQTGQFDFQAHPDCETLPALLDVEAIGFGSSPRPDSCPPSRIPSTKPRVVMSPWSLPSQGSQTVVSEDRPVVGSAASSAEAWPPEKRPNAPIRSIADLFAVASALEASAGTTEARPTTTPLVSFCGPAAADGPLVLVCHDCGPSVYNDDCGWPASGDRPEAIGSFDRSLDGGDDDTPAIYGTQKLPYIFTQWRHCDMFVYFSHERVSVPPDGVIAASHRNGCKCLGTVIFEWAKGRYDMGRLGSCAREAARALAVLADRLNFDGWLINIESDADVEPGWVFEADVGKACDDDAAPDWEPGADSMHAFTHWLRHECKQLAA